MSSLPAIPVVTANVGDPAAVLSASGERWKIILATARRRYGPVPLLVADRLSRRWAEESDLPYRDEIAAIAAALRPARGAWMLNLSYEWGCTTATVATAAGPPRLIRALDWQLPTLGATLIALRRRGPAGAWLALTWPGFVGAVQAVAGGRFAAAINFAPYHPSGFGRVGDWVASKLAIWRNRLLPPSFLLRQVFDLAPDFAAARQQLIDTPICAPALFTLVGVRAGEAVLIERTERDSVVHDGVGAVTNHWLTSRFAGISRSYETTARLAAMRDYLAGRGSGEGDSGEGAPFAWLRAPILNPETRLALEAEPARGRVLAMGIESGAPATAPLTLQLGGGS